jgi:transposase
MEPCQRRGRLEADDTSVLGGGEGTGGAGGPSVARKELGSDHGTIGRVAKQLGIGTESLRSWVRQAEIDDGVKPGVTSAEATRVKELEQEVRELRRANEILRRASAYFAQAELDRPWK